MLLIMPTYKAKVSPYKTSSGDIWDIIALRVYGDTRCMHILQDVNFEHRFVDVFLADVELEVPLEVSIEFDNRSAVDEQIDIKKLLPWR